MRKSSRFRTNVSSLCRQARFLAVLALLCHAPGPATAADIAVLGGAGAYDLAADGATFSMSVRATQPVLPWVRVEAAVALAWPAPRDETRYGLYQPEIGLLLTWPRQGWTPYICAATGAAGFDDKYDSPDWEWTLSGGVGAFIPIGPRLDLRAEIRRREIGKEFSASITDIGVGLAFRLW
jgi:hypothetical protein